MSNKQLGKWSCNSCGETKHVTNGVCPNCGPVQTTPVDEVAQKIAGTYEEPEQPTEQPDTDE